MRNSSKLEPEFLSSFAIDCCTAAYLCWKKCVCGNREILRKCSARGGPGSDVLGCFAYVVQRCFVLFSEFLMAKAKHVFFFEKHKVFVENCYRCR